MNKGIEWRKASYEAPVATPLELKSQRGFMMAVMGSADLPQDADYEENWYEDVVTNV